MNAEAVEFCGGLQGELSCSETGAPSSFVSSYRSTLAQSSVSLTPFLSSLVVASNTAAQAQRLQFVPAFHIERVVRLSPIKLYDGHERPERAREERTDNIYAALARAVTETQTKRRDERRSR